jgi:LysR family hydrogen peroxide-inducible transcriptional activator
MNIKDLKYLVALADHNHFGKAAEACFVSQPALSMQIKKLEESLGVKLLERSNKSVRLTDNGFTISERARLILNQVKEMCDVAKLAQDPFSGELRLGVFPTLGPYLLPLIIPQLSKAYPKLSIYLVEGHSAHLIEKIKRGELHAAFLAAPVVDNSFAHELLFTEEFMVAVANSHVLAKQKKIKQQDLDKQQLLLLEEGHCLREQALALCSAMKNVEHMSFRATSLETLRHMVSAGVGITLMPRLACTASQVISYIPFAKPKPSRSVGLFWGVGSAKQELLRHMVGKVKGILGKSSLLEVF